MIPIPDSRSAAFVATASRGLQARLTGKMSTVGNSEAGTYASMSLRELARACVQRAGGAVHGLSVNQLFSAALHSTSDFPSILENVVSKSLRDRYELAPRTFRALGRQGSLPDYREASRVQLGEAPVLEKVLEGGEYKHGTIGDAAEKYRLFKYGKVLNISREAMINDDLSALTRLPAAMGAAAAQLENQLFWAHFTGNPTMHDGTALFASGHGNLAGSGTAITIDAIGAGRTAMRKQKGLDGNHFVAAAPAFLVVPAALETKAEQFVSTNLRADSAGSVNPFSGRLQVISEPWLDENSATAWYLWADPNMIDTLEYGYLAGEDGPQIEQKPGFEVDGLALKVRLDFGVKAIDWRGLYKNPGA